MKDYERRARQRDLQNEAKEALEAQKEARKNGNFTQVEKDDGWRALRMLIKENPLAAEIFTFLAEKMDRQNSVIASMKVLGEVTGKGRTAISKAVNYLAKKGYLMIGKSGSSNVYIMNPDLVWESWRTSKKQIEFDGRIILSKEENKHLQEQMDKLAEKRTNVVTLKERKAK